MNIRGQLSEVSSLLPPCHGSWRSSTDVPLCWASTFAFEASLVFFSRSLLSVLFSCPALWFAVVVEEPGISCALGGLVLCVVVYVPHSTLGIWAIPVS